MDYMDRDSRYDILFDTVDIGPVKSKNRFYQVPHCNGGGYRDPSAAAEMRGIKSQGGWGVIFTEQCEMHHSSEITPFIELRLWDDADIPMIAKMADRMKEYGALAGIQLAYSGINGPNLYTKEVPLAVTGMPIRTFTNDPVSARSLDKEDIKNLLVENTCQILRKANEVNAGHIGGSISMSQFLLPLMYFLEIENHLEYRLVLSKGHASLAHSAILNGVF